MIQHMDSRILSFSCKASELPTLTDVTEVLSCRSSHWCATRPFAAWAFRALPSGMGTVL